MYGSKDDSQVLSPQQRALLAELSRLDSRVHEQAGLALFGDITNTATLATSTSQLPLQDQSQIAPGSSGIAVHQATSRGFYQRARLSEIIGSAINFETSFETTSGVEEDHDQEDEGGNDRQEGDVLPDSASDQRQEEGARYERAQLAIDFDVVDPKSSSNRVRTESAGSETEESRIADVSNQRSAFKDIDELNNLPLNSHPRQALLQRRYRLDDDEMEPPSNSKKRLRLDKPISTGGTTISEIPTPSVFFEGNDGESTGGYRPTTLPISTVPTADTSVGIAFRLEKYSGLDGWVQEDHLRSIAAAWVREQGPRVGNDHSRATTQDLINRVSTALRSAVVTLPRTRNPSGVVNFEGEQAFQYLTIAAQASRSENRIQAQMEMLNKTNTMLSRLVVSGERLDFMETMSLSQVLQLLKQCIEEIPRIVHDLDDEYRGAQDKRLWCYKEGFWSYLPADCFVHHLPIAKRLYADLLALRHNGDIEAGEGAGAGAGAGVRTRSRSAGAWFRAHERSASMAPSSDNRHIGVDFNDRFSQFISMLKCLLQESRIIRKGTDLKQIKAWFLTHRQEANFRWLGDDLLLPHPSVTDGNGDANEYEEDDDDDEDEDDDQAGRTKTGGFSWIVELIKDQVNL